MAKRIATYSCMEAGDEEENPALTFGALVSISEQTMETDISEPLSPELYVSTGSDRQLNDRLCMDRIGCSGLLLVHMRFDRS